MISPALIRDFPAPRDASGGGTVVRGKLLSLGGLVFVLLLAWLPALVALPPLDRDESRFAEASRQMVETGNLVDIRFASGPRYNKPIGIYWLQSLASAIAGPKSRGTIQVYRIPSLVGGLLSAILLWLSARGIASREAALVSALFLGTTFLLSAESVIATTDACLLASVIAAQSVLLRVYLAARQQRPPPGTGFVMLGWLAVGFGVLLKGPIILAVLAVTVVALSVWDRDVGWLKGTKPLRGAALAIALVLPWAVAIGFASHGAFYEQSLGQDFAAKIMGGKESHGAPPGYYLVETVFAFWPATLVLVPAIIWALVQRRDPLIRFLLAWSVGTWLLFELTPTKLPHYVLPAYPALALLCGLWAVQTGYKDRFSKLPRIFSAALFLVGVAAVTAACLYAPLRFGGRLHGPAIAGASLAAIIGCGAAVELLRSRIVQAAGLAITAAVGFDLVVGIAAVPQLHDLWLSPRATALVAANRRADDAPPVVTGYVEPSLVFLLGPDTRIAPASTAAQHLARGGLALVERRALPEFLAGAASSRLLAKPLGDVHGLDYSTGRHELVTLYRVKPAGR